MTDKLNKAIAVLKKVKHWIDYGAGELEPTANAVIEAIDTVVAELEKPLPCDCVIGFEGDIPVTHKLCENCKSKI